MKELTQMNYDDLIEHTNEVIEALRRKAYSEGYAQGKFDAKMEKGYEGVQRAVDDILRNATDQMEYGAKRMQTRRDEIVEQAKADIEGLKYTPYREYFVKGLYACGAEFIVNKGKRTVVVLMRGLGSGKMRAKGIAKCAPDDCFNVHIGKAIALRRALGIDVPSEYLNAPQPTEVRVGDVTGYPYDEFLDEETVVSVDYNEGIIKYNGGVHDEISDLFEDDPDGLEWNLRIIDDSRDEEAE